MSDWLLQIPTLSLSSSNKEGVTNKSTSFTSNLIQTAINDADSTFKKLFNQNKVSNEEQLIKEKAAQDIASKAVVQARESIEEVLKLSTTQSDLELIEDLDNLPIFLGNDLRNRYDATAELINTMIDSIMLQNKLSLTNAIDMLKVVAEALKPFENLTSLDFVNIFTTNMCNCQASRSAPQECLFLPLFLLGLNLSFYIKNAPKKELTYKQAKEKAEQKEKQKEKSEKERMLDFAAAFEFGIN